MPIKITIDTIVFVLTFFCLSTDQQNADCKETKWLHFGARHSHSAAVSTGLLLSIVKVMVGLPEVLGLFNSTANQNILCISC